MDEVNSAAFQEALAMTAVGSGFVLGKIGFNTLLVDSSSQEELRRSIAG